MQGKLSVSRKVVPDEVLAVMKSMFLRSESRTQLQTQLLQPFETHSHSKCGTYTSRAVCSRSHSTQPE